MTTIYPHEIPAPQSRYMPKKQGNLARRILDAAWQRHQERQFPEDERKRIGEIVSTELERRFPVADMDVLERYGLTHVEGKPETETEYLRNPETGLHTGERREVPTGKLRKINVRAYNPHSDNWEGVGVEPARSVRVAGSGGFGSRSELTANARAARKSAPYGVSPEWQARHKAEGKWEEICANNERYFDELEANALPPETDAFFQRIMDLRRDYKELYQGFNGYLDSFRGDTKPTWAEIESRFPFIGEYLAELRAGAVTEAA
jgi:hypothetical protein